MLAAGLLAACPLAACPLAARAAPEVWVGPMPFVEGRTLRPDYLPTLLDASRWPAVLRQARVLKSYLMVLPTDPVTPGGPPQASDAELRALAAFAKRHRLKVAFEVGGIRMAPGTPNDQAGEFTARSELTYLRRWLKAGGRIDYLTTDHAVMLTVGAHYVSPADSRDTGMALSQAIEELVDYFAIVHREMPGARLGVIESLGFFTVEEPGGRRFERTVPALPIWRFGAFLEELQAAMRRRKLTLDHFHIDFGYEGARHDGRGALDCGRILAVERAARARGVRSGVIVNAFHDAMSERPASDAGSAQAALNTLRFVDAYVAAGGRAEHLVVQTWQPYPDRTGPESDPNTVLGLARRVLERMQPRAAGGKTTMQGRPAPWRR